MILSDREIQDAIARESLIVDPAPPSENYSPTAVDLRLADQIKVWDDTLVQQTGVDVHLSFDDVEVPELARWARDATLDPDGYFVLRPREFALGQTLERIGFPLASRLAGRVEGRSSLARLGVVVHLTAPTIHADFGGDTGAPLTLEIVNLGPFHIRLRPGVSRICQVIVERVEGEFGAGLTSTFRDQRDPLGGA
jgi:dCTP deaminase